VTLVRSHRPSYGNHAQGIRHVTNQNHISLTVTYTERGMQLANMLSTIAKEMSYGLLGNAKSNTSLVPAIHGRWMFWEEPGSPVSFIMLPSARRRFCLFRMYIAQTTNVASERNHASFTLVASLPARFTPVLSHTILPLLSLTPVK
jgi:hypothetical protein